jgi:hypothetical protein
MQVFEDINRGKQKDYYLSISIPIEESTQDNVLEYSNTTLRIEKNSRDLETDFSFITNSFLASIKKEKSHG